MKEESETDDTDVLRLYIDDDEVKSINSDCGLFADNGLFDSMIKCHCFDLLLVSAELFLRESNFNACDLVKWKSVFNGVETSFIPVEETHCRFYIKTYHTTSLFFNFIK